MAIFSHVPNVFQSVPNIKKLWNKKNGLFAMVICILFQCSKVRPVSYIFFLLLKFYFFIYFYSKDIYKFGTLEH